MSSNETSADSGPDESGDESSEPDGGGGGGGGGGGDSDPDSLQAARNLSYGRPKKKDADIMKGFGKVPTNIAEWPRFRRLVFKTVGAACGTPQMGTDMLLAAESHQGPPDKIKTYDAW